MVGERAIMERVGRSFRILWDGKKREMSVVFLNCRAGTYVFIRLMGGVDKRASEVVETLFYSYVF